MPWFTFGSRIALGPGDDLDSEKILTGRETCLEGSGSASDTAYVHGWHLCTAAIEGGVLPFDEPTGNWAYDDWWTVHHEMYSV